MIFLIAGPTASGKSALALRLAEALGGEIVNADSMQLYGDLRILTARPSPDDENRARHHLFGVADAAEAWSVGRWLRTAGDTLADIERRGRAAIVVGGTGLYFRALTRGLAEIPPVPRQIREEAQAAFETLGEAAFRERLATVDQAAAARIAPGDRQRLVRAWEVFGASGRALSDWQGATAPTVPAGAWRGFVLSPPREALFAACDARLTAMVGRGALDEVARLVARGLDLALPAMKALGVAPFAAQLRGEVSAADALARAGRETRRYAKRQITWFRHQTPDWPRLDASEPAEAWRQFLALDPALTASLKDDIF